MRDRKRISDEEFEAAYANPDNRGILGDVYRKFNRALSEDELQSCGMLALWRAMQYFDPSYRQKFTTSLYRFANWECYRALAEEERAKRKGFVPLTRHDEANSAISYSKRPVGDLHECLEMMDNSYHQEILRRYYFDHESARDIARSFGVLTKVVRNSLQAATESLHGVLSK